MIGYDAWKTNAPPLGRPDEACDGCGSDLGYTAYRVRGTVLGECCVDVLPEPCDQCRYFTCVCREED